MATGSNPAVAYFSMEICLEEAIPTYSGGLGVLALADVPGIGWAMVLAGASLLVVGVWRFVVVRQRFESCGGA